MKRRKFLAATAASAGTLVFPAIAIGQQYKAEYKMSTVVPPAFAWGKGGEIFGNLVRERTNGRINIKRVARLAHRVSWELHNGPIPKGAQVCHHCDNPACVRPDHLFLGDHLANARDRDAKGRSANLHGERNPKAKLTEADVREIRRIWDSSPRHSMMGLPEQFGVSQSAIQFIVHRRSWKHVK